MTDDNVGTSAMPLPDGHRARLISAPEDFNVGDLYIDIGDLFHRSLMLKCEGFNFAGSVKLKSALGMLAKAEREGAIAAGKTIIESSSGNLGIALSLLAASRGYRLICITDIRCNPVARKLMETFGAKVEVVTEPAGDGSGLLGARIQRVRELCALDENLIWLNQYANDANWEMHAEYTAREIAAAFPALDLLFVGAGTTGTLMGCARYFKEIRADVKVIAVDSVGSVTFGDGQGLRLIPGLGASVRPEILDESLVDDVVFVSEEETIQACYKLVRRGWLFGGSTGTVVSGAIAWLDKNDADHSLQALAIAPDLGERYLSSVYDFDWLCTSYGPEFARDLQHQATAERASRWSMRDLA